MRSRPPASSPTPRESTCRARSRHGRRRSRRRLASSRGWSRTSSTTPSATPRRAARSACRSGVPDEHAEVSVVDGCGGIPADDLDRVFDLAYRGDAARTPGAGSGARARPGHRPGLRRGPPRRHRRAQRGRRLSLHGAVARWRSRRRKGSRASKPSTAFAKRRTGHDMADVARGGPLRRSVAPAWCRGTRPRARSSTVRGLPEATFRGPSYGIVRGEGEHVGSGHVADVHEVPRLAAVLEHPGGLAPSHCRPEQRRHTRVRACRADTGGRRRCGSAARSPPSRARGRRSRRGAPGGAWWRRRCCAGPAGADLLDQRPGHRRCAHRARWLVPAGRQRGHRSRSGALVAVLGAAVPALAVDHHRRREDDAALRTRGGAGPTGPPRCRRRCRPRSPARRRSRRPARPVTPGGTRRRRPGPRAATPPGRGRRRGAPRRRRATTGA